MAVLVDVVVFDRDIYKTGHMANRWMHVLVAHFVEHAIAAAPVHTGYLRGGIEGSARHVGDRQLEGVISSSAPYTTFVLHGTGFPVKGHEGHIWSTRGFITRDVDDAYVELWGTWPRGGRFSRTAKGPLRGRRRQFRVRKRGYWMKLPPLGRASTFRFVVRGQEPNNFLVKAWARTGRTHSSIRGIAPAASIAD